MSSPHVSPHVPLRGQLEQHPLAALLRFLLHERRDGCLTVSRGAITRRLYLRRGMIIYASSNDRADRLGEILTAQGKITRAEHKKYWEESLASNRLLGSTLLVNGRITLPDLYQGVTAQVVTILERLQKWRKGEYEFVAGDAPKEGTVLLSIPLALYLKADSGKAPAARRRAARAAVAGAAGKPPAGEESAAVDQEAEIPIEPTEGAPAGDEQERLREVSFMVQELRTRAGQDPAGLLGVAAGADREAVQAAHHRIAKVLHPDRLPAGIDPELAREAEELFRDVTAAVQGLEERPRAQQPWLPSPQERRLGPPVPSPEEDQARRFFAQGREWVSKRNYWQAADALRQAVRLRPAEATYRQFLGLALVQIKRLHEAEEHLVEATRLDPSSATHLVNLGRVYRSGRVYRKAREAFERALRIDPRNEQAREELSDLPEEPAAGKKPESRGLLKKIFGK